MDEKNYYLGFSLAKNIGPVSLRKLINHFGSARLAWEGSEIELRKAGLGEKTYEQFKIFREEFNFEEYLEKLARAKVWLVASFEKEYPKGLRDLQNPPIVIFGRGDKSCLNLSRSIGVVGTRKVTSYGREVTESLVSDLVLYGFTIISGMALGVDAIAHTSCLDNNGKTIAVLGNGVDLPFPRENQGLYQKIIESAGAVISEYPPGTNPSKGIFPARNRIIAGLSLGVLITEAAEDSGSLITAQWGLKLGKKVFAVPGPITSRMSDGSLKLLRQGATLVSGVEDILREFKGQNAKCKSKSQKLKVLNLSKEELKIVRLLENESMTIDEIARKLKMPIWQISALLSELEMRGAIKQDLGSYRLDC